MEPTQPWPAPPVFEGEVREGVSIAVRPETPLICTECCCEDAPAYYLKRRRGLYALLCFKNGQGCWERSGRTICSHVDGLGAQCQNLAEYEIVSLDERSSVVSCVGHIPFLMRSAVPGQLIYPLED